jgi:hypothetical protein
MHTTVPVVAFLHQMRKICLSLAVAQSRRVRFAVLLACDRFSVEEAAVRGVLKLWKAQYPHLVGDHKFCLEFSVGMCIMLAPDVHGTGHPSRGQLHSKHLRVSSR